MSIATDLLSEFEAQAEVTRRFLERLPEDKLTWKPHDRSMTAGQLALHLARVPAGVIRAVQMPSHQAPDFSNIPQPASRDEVLKTFEESISAVRDLLPRFDDAAMNEMWRLMAGDQELFVEPRKQFVRDIMFSHWYQHRGQFSVYLRMLDVPVPTSWGPSADESPVMPKPKAAIAA